MSDEREGVLDNETDLGLAEVVDESTRPKEGFLFCTACSHLVGHVEDRIEVNGSFVHTCTNPYGYVHHFGCHRDAPGCAIGGPPHSADSWFTGFRWRLATCGNCDMHLGWLFERSGDHFYGLILDRIQAG